jgi:hypothetical protein
MDLVSECVSQSVSLVKVTQQRVEVKMREFLISAPGRKAEWGQ